MKRHIRIGTLAVACLVSFAGAAQAEDAITAPAAKTIGATTATKMVPSLAVLNSGGATLVDGKLTMTGITPNSIVFADRPVRSAGHVLTTEFIKEWDEGKDSFAVDPPNATISVLSSDGTAVEDAVVVLTKPKLDGGTLTFDVQVLEGDIAKANGPASLFIDMFVARAGIGRVGVVGVGAVGFHGGWYAHPAARYGAAVATGAAIGAAAASAPYYYHPPCGYYPYPPCY
ncbi:hypothetical protein ACS4RR_026195 (plasmid) [Rhizobium sp. Z1P35]